MIRRLPPALVLGTNLVAGVAVLVWVLARYGAPAARLLTAHVDGGWLALFAATAATAFTIYTWRWQLLLAELGTPCGLGSLAAIRAAGHSVSTLLPSAKLGGEPLRAFLLARRGAPGAQAIASIAVDRVLEMGAAAAFACLYGVLLLRRGVPELEGAVVTVALGAAALVAGVAVTVRRLRRGGGLVTVIARHTRLDRLAFVRTQMDVLAAAEAETARLVARPRPIARAFATGLLANAVVLLEHCLLLGAFGLPTTPAAVVAAVFAAGAAHSLPVPAALGALEGAQIWLFGVLGHPPAVGLGVALAVRLRELLWILPGLLYLLALGLRGTRWRPVLVDG